MLPHVHWSIIYNNLDMEATEVSTDGWMDKKNVIYIHSAILSGHKILPFATTG